MSDQQQAISRSQSAYPPHRPPLHHPPYGSGSGPPPPPPPPPGRLHHSYTDSAVIAGTPGPSSATGYPMTPNPAYQPLSYNQAPYSNGAPANLAQSYAGPSMQPPPGPVHSRSDSAVPILQGAPSHLPTYWSGPSQAVGPEKRESAGLYSPPPGMNAQPPLNHASPSTSSSRQSFGSYQDYVSRHHPPPPLPRKEFTAPVGPSSSGAPPFGFATPPPPPPPLPPKILLPNTPEAVPQSELPSVLADGDEQQQSQQPIQSSPKSMTQEVMTPNASLQPGDDELDRALRLSMESYAAENQHQAPVDEDEEARILRESREEYERQQERNRMMNPAHEETEEEMMARVMAMSLAEEVNKQKQIERQIQRSSRDNMPGPSRWGGGSSSSRPSFDDPDTELPYRTSSLTHSASTSSNSSAGQPYTPRPQIVTSLSSPLGSRSTTPNPSQMQQSSFQSLPHSQPPNPLSPTSPTSPNSMEMLPRYEEVASSPQQSMSQPHLSPVLTTTPGLSPTPSSVPQSSVLESPSLQLPQSMSDSTMSPVGLSPVSQISPSMSPQQQGSPPHRQQRPLSSHAQTLPTTPTGGAGLHRGNSSPSTGAILNQHAQHQSPPGPHGLRNSRSSTQLRPNPPMHQSGGPNVPPVPLVPTVMMPVPSMPAGPMGPVPPGVNGDIRGRVSPQPPAASGPPPPMNMNVAGPSTSPGGKRIHVEPEYSNKVSFGYMPPLLDQPVIPPCPDFPETVVIQADAAFHIAAPTWHHLLKLLARLGEAKVIISPAAFSTLPLQASAGDMRLILHFHKSKVGGEWRVVLWIDYNRGFPRSMTPNERGRWSNGDTTMLPWGCRIPEESLSGTLRGPGPMEVSTSLSDIVYVLQGPFPKLPTTLSNIAAILQEAYLKSKQSSSTGVASYAEGGVPQVDRGSSLKRLSKAVDKIWPPSKQAAVASGVLKRPESGVLVAVGGKRSMGDWFRSGFGRMVGSKEEKGGQWNNEGEFADLVTPFSLDRR